MEYHKVWFVEFCYSVNQQNVNNWVKELGLTLECEIRNSIHIFVVLNIQQPVPGAVIP